MLPRVDIMVIIHPGDRHKAADDFGNLVSAEIPRQHTDAGNEKTIECLIRARAAVVIHMAHGPCGAKNSSEFLAKSVEGAA
jgi:hypothetical protein